MKRMNPSLDVTLAANQASPRFVYNLYNGGNDNGGYGHEPFEVFMRFGCASLAQTPYVAGQVSELPPIADYIEGLHRRTANFVWLWDWSSTAADIEQCKLHLDNGGVAVVGIHAGDPSFANWGSGGNYTPWTGSACTFYDIDHMVCVCGYGPGWYLIANSWGTSFGSNGFIYVSAAYFEDYVSDFMFPIEGSHAAATRYATVAIDHPRRGDIQDAQFVVNGAEVCRFSPMIEDLPRSGSYIADARSNVSFTVDISTAPWSPVANVVTVSIADRVTSQIGTIAAVTVLLDGTTYASVDPPVPIGDNDGMFAAAAVAMGGASNDQPRTPVNVTPASGAGGMALDPYLVSSAFDDPDSNDVHRASWWQVSMTSSFDTILWDSGEDSAYLTNVPVPVTLNETNVYHWRVRYKYTPVGTTFNWQWTPYSEPTWFETRHDFGPDTPSNVLPLYGATGQELSPVLVSSPFHDPDTTEVHRASQWQVSTTASFETIVWNSGEVSTYLTNVTVSVLLADTNQYHWRVRYKYTPAGTTWGWQWTPYSVPTWFETRLDADPDPPCNLLPVDGAVEQPLSPALVASTFHDPDTTEVHRASQWQVSTTTSFTSAVWDSYEDGTHLTNVVVGMALAQSNMYYWRVRYKYTPAGTTWNWKWTSFGTATCFSTWYNRAPDMPHNIMPADGADDQPLSPNLTASAFHDPDANDVHRASQWQASLTDTFDTVAWDSGEDAANLTTTTVLATLARTNVYHWRVRYKFTPVGTTWGWQWTPYSAATWFMTSGPDGEGWPVVAITTAATHVSYDVTLCMVAGTNNRHVVGGISWTNATNGANGSVPASSLEFQVPDIPLDIGANTIAVYGTNIYGSMTNDSMVITRGPVGTGMPYLDATTTPALVSHDVTSWTVAGTNNQHVMGAWWSNAASGISGPATCSGETWQADVLLARAATDTVNRILILGTNLWNQQVSDSVDIVAGGFGTGVPFVQVTTAVVDGVAYAVTGIHAVVDVVDATNIVVMGTNNFHIVGTMVLMVSNINDHTVATGTVPATLSWTSESFELGIGTNIVLVSGTNLWNGATNDWITVVNVPEGTWWSVVVAMAWGVAGARRRRLARVPRSSVCR